MKNIAYVMRDFIYFLFNSFLRPNVLSNKVPILLKFSKTNKIGRAVFIDINTSLGKYNFIAENTIITKSKIGSYCSIAPYVKIGLGEHDYKKVSSSVRFIKDSYSVLTQSDCVIGNDVWIGTNAVVLRGVNIGDGAVIGANAVVTKDIPPFAIAVGVPAKVIKYRFSKEKIKQIIESKWWNYDIEEAKVIIGKL